MSKKFEPTKKQRSTAENASGVGMSQKDICHLIINPETQKPIGLETLNRCFRDELNMGGAKVKFEIGSSLIKLMRRGNTSATIFLAKTRLGLSEKLNLEHTGPDGKPIPVEIMPVDRAAQTITDLAGKTGVDLGGDENDGND